MPITYDHLTRIWALIDSYILPEFKWKIITVYAVIFILVLLRLYLGKPFLVSFINYLSRTPVFIKLMGSHPRFVMRFFRFFHMIFSNFLPLMFPFFIAALVQMFRSDRLRQPRQPTN